ncbi:hypothetical protein V5E97_16945 [Singulisphaera sp. Ch08]|uniref:DUF2007 domain-containing protein n=1 Tax=Singulisphaera sp. Ch08 TaxID=3120278 RepID=A0AAU7CRS4_9BACT
MLSTISETTMWQRHLASVIRSGLIDRAAVVDFRGLHAVVGVYKDGSYSAPLAKYSEYRRAEDAMAVVQRLAEPTALVEAN